MNEGRGLISSLDDRFNGIKTAYNKSDEVLSRISKSLVPDKDAEQNYCLVANGSLARRELTESSDFDAFLIADSSMSESQLKSEEELWSSAKEGSGLSDPGSSGTFVSNSIINIDEMIRNIGGTDDDNNKFTQRMLVILESTSIGKDALYHNMIEKILERYISDRITNHQLGLFLLNDIIRYYRTICIDFEFKTIEQSKPWGLRNIKLVYSRKLIYFAGIVMCAELAQQSWQEKRRICKMMIGMTPIERLLYIFGSEIHKSLVIYDRFLVKISDPDVRAELNDVSSEGRMNSEVFTNLKNDGHHFSWALRSAFVNHYDASHPIHKAIMF